MKWIKKVFHLLSSCQISSLSTPSHSSPPFLFLVLYRSKSHVANQHIYVRLRGMKSTTTKPLTELESCVSNNKEWEQNTWLGSKSPSINTSGTGTMASTFFRDPTQMSGMRGTWTSLSAGAHGPGTRPGWHHQKPPGRATLSLRHHCKSQAKESFTDLAQTHRKPSHWKERVWKIKGVVADGKNISPDHWKSSCIGSTLNLQKVKAKLTDVQWFSLFQEIQKIILENKFHWEQILQNSHAFLQRAAANAYTRKVNSSKGKGFKVLWFAQ